MWLPGARIRVALTAGSLLIAAACRQPAAPSANARFRIRDVAPDTFRIEISHSAAVVQAESLQQDQQPRIVVGVPQAGDAGYNAPWHWHLEPSSVGFAEVTIEACQTTARLLEASLSYWLSFGQVCIEGTVDARER
jgi:hypothetical protein